jgi:short-subunit dehydrogenase
MFNYTGKTALITGASSGIGEAFAHILAALGMNVVLVARSADKLRALAQELSEQHSIRAEIIPADLCREGAAQEVYLQTQALGVAVDLLVNNAGFDTLAPQWEHEELMLNVTALVDLAHTFVSAMVERKAGGIINVSSMAAFQPMPYQAVYGATKAFVLSFSLALWAEYRKLSVRVVALCPGPTATNFFTVLGAAEVPKMGSLHTPEAVVMAGLHAGAGAAVCRRGPEECLWSTTDAYDATGTDGAGVCEGDAAKQEVQSGGERSTTPLASRSRP